MNQWKGKSLIQSVKIWLIQISRVWEGIGFMWQITFGIFIKFLGFKTCESIKKNLPASRAHSHRAQLA